MELVPLPKEGEDGALRVNSALLRTLIDALPEAVYFVDPHRRIHVWNARAELVTGYSRDEMEGRHCFEGYLDHIDEAGTHLCVTQCPLHTSIERGCPVQGSAYLQHRDGYRVPVHLRAVPIYDENGTLLGDLETFEDLSPCLAELHHDPERAGEGYVCPVTGIASRKYAAEFLEERLEASIQAHIPFGAILLSFEGLKGVEEAHGRAVADLVVRLHARTVSNDISVADCLARWTENTLIVLKPRIRPGQTESLAARLRVLALNTFARGIEGSGAAPVMVGCATAAPGDSFDSFVARLEAGLHEDRGRSIPVDTQPALKSESRDRSYKMA